MRFEDALEAMREGYEVAVERDCTDVMILKIERGEILELDRKGNWDDAWSIPVDLIMSNDWWRRR